MAHKLLNKIPVVPFHGLFILRWYILLNKIPVVPFHGLFILRGYILLKKIVLTIYFYCIKKYGTIYY